MEFEDTRNLGQGKPYHEVKVPWGGSLFPAYQLNHSYVDCDVYVSLAKLKNHATAGVTLGMKNNFGITPIALYGQHEPDERSTSARVAIFHEGRDRPADGLPQELDPNSPRRPTTASPGTSSTPSASGRSTWRSSTGSRRSPAARGPGSRTGRAGAGPPDRGTKPGLHRRRRHGRHGLRPEGAPGTGPFPGDNHLALAAALGLGTNDPKRIEVVGLSLKEARHPFGWGAPPAEHLTGTGTGKRTETPVGVEPT